MRRYLLLTSLLFCSISSIAQSYRDGEAGKGCKAIDDTTCEQVTINKLTHKFYLYSKSYAYTDTARKHHYKGIVILYDFHNSFIEEKRAFAKFIIEKYDLEELTIVSSCQVLNAAWSSLRLNKEYEDRKRKMIAENTVMFSKKGFK